jgi:hypothetical protein
MLTLGVAKVWRNSVPPHLTDHYNIFSNLLICKDFGGAYRDRTDDLNAASVALSQLS